MDRIEALTVFLGALDEWDCDDNADRAKAIIQFLDGGCDLSAYDERRNGLRVIRGGKEGD